jgi:ankyrin repeat protein
LDACRENRTDEVTEWLDKRANPLFEQDGWNPLLWAACNGNEQIVRALIKHNAIAPYLNQKGSNVDSDDKNKTNNDDEANDPFVKPKDARKVGKYTPLHWASYKGFHKVVWILLKEGMSALDIDMYGNTAVHQAAAAG